MCVYISVSMQEYMFEIMIFHKKCLQNHVHCVKAHILCCKSMVKIWKQFYFSSLLLFLNQIPLLPIVLFFFYAFLRSLSVN